MNVSLRPVFVAIALIVWTSLGVPGCTDEAKGPVTVVDAPDADTADAVDTVDDAVTVADLTPETARDALPDAEPVEPPLIIDTLWHASDTFQIGTFNIDWLFDEYGAEYTPRTETDFEQIAALIRAIDVEVLALQEIDGEGAISRLGLPEPWRAVVGDSGWSQNPALLYRADRVQVHSAQEIILPSSEFPSKDPFVVEFERLGTGDRWLAIVLHFHPFTDGEAVAARRTQAAELVVWIDEAVDDEGEPWVDRMIVMGDLNDTREGISRGYGTAILSLLDHPDLTVATDVCDGGTTLGYESRIDHILVGARIADAWSDAGGECRIVRHDEISPWSDYEGGWDEEQNVSTHRPIFISVDGPI